MYNTTSCEVVEANLIKMLVFPRCKPAVARPHPSDHDWIDIGRHTYCENEVSWKLNSFGYSSTHDSSSCCTECPLEEPISRLIGRSLVAICISLQKLMTKEVLIASKHLLICKGRIEAIGKGVTANVPTHRTDTNIHHVFHQDVRDVFLSASARFHHGEACLHQHNQKATNEHPHCIHRSSIQATPFLCGRRVDRFRDFCILLVNLFMELLILGGHLSICRFELVQGILHFR
mmetsp:Transcript_34731/g.53976  ORF Transcript_34731/g.53976 Transcript_34731/m.53976 type:complete len:232 (-) Transcript_34731:159-854(-)